MSGYIAIHRKVFDHPAFKQEKFTEREAWMWLIAEAAWQDRRKRVGRKVFDLKRGQLMASFRFMATAWQWSLARVVRFIVRLETDGMLSTTAEHEATRITICKYDEYQPRRNTDETKTDTPAIHSRNKLEEVNNLKTDDDGEPAPLVSREAINLANEVAIVCGHDPEFVPPEWMGAAWTVQRWLNEGWGAAAIMAACKETMARKRDGPPTRIEYFEKPIAKFIARQSAPLPKVEVVKQETVHVVQGFGGQNQRGNLSDAAKRLAASFAENRPGIGGQPGGDPVRLLPEGRRE